MPLPGQHSCYPMREPLAAEAQGQMEGRVLATHLRSCLGGVEGAHLLPGEGGEAPSPTSCSSQPGKGSGAELAGCPPTRLSTHTLTSSSTQLGRRVGSSSTSPPQGGGGGIGCRPEELPPWVVHSWARKAWQVACPRLPHPPALCIAAWVRSNAQCNGTACTV